MFPVELQDDTPVDLDGLNQKWATTCAESIARLSAPQAKPVPGKYEVSPYVQKQIWDQLGINSPVAMQLCADLQARIVLGKAKYGFPLQSHNGRSTWRDLYEELCDALHYNASLCLEEPNDPVVHMLYQQTLQLTISTCKVMLERQ